MSSVRTVSLNEVVVGSRPTHIVIYQESNDPHIVNAREHIHSFAVNDPLVNVPPPQQAAEPLQKEIKELRDRVAQLEKFIESLDASPSPRPSPFFHAQISGPVGLEVRRLEEPPAEPVPVATVFETLVKSVRATPALDAQPAPSLPVEEVPLDEKEQVDHEVKDEVEHEVEEEDHEVQQEVEDEEHEVEEEEGEAMELIEFEYKGATYYRDAENQVYQKDDDGDLDDDPIGVWNESKQKVLKYPKK